MSDTGRPVKQLAGDSGLTAPDRPIRSANAHKPHRTGRLGGITVPIDRDVLRERRLAAYLTQAQLAGLAGVSTSYICELETGRYNPGIDGLRALARVLGCDVNDLKVAA